MEETCKMISLFFDKWWKDRDLMKHFRNSGSFDEYILESDHTTTFLTRKDYSWGYVFVGTPHKCFNFIERMHILKQEYVENGLRISPEIVDFNDGIAGFTWAASRSRK